MTDAEFTEEIANRLNALLRADEARAMQGLTTPMVHAGYANVGHFLGQLCLPAGVDHSTPPDQLQNVKFLMPVIGENGRINSFRAVTGEELAQEHAQMQERRAQAKDDESKIH